MNKITAVLTAAGYATRFLPWSYTLPKEMLPILVNGVSIPAIQYVFEYLYDLGIRRFIIVIRKNKEVIMSHFSRDEQFLELLKRKNKIKEEMMLEKFFSKVDDSIIYFVPTTPNGFGGAVLSTEKYVESDYIFIAAPDVILYDTITLKGENFILASFSSEPQKYGVVYGDKYLEKIEEKPQNPKSNKIFLGYAMLETEIYDYLKEEKPDKNDEIQLTPAISRMAKERKIRVFRVNNYYDIGNPEEYLKYLLQTNTRTSKAFSSSFDT